MSFPNIPNVNPDINLSREDVVKLLLSSIAFEELGLAHIINAEAEKIQYILGTLEGSTPVSPATLEDLLNINDSAEQILRSVIKNQMLLQFKLEDTLSISTSSTTTSTSTTTTTTTSTTSTTTSTTIALLCDPGLTFAVFANSNFEVASGSIIDTNTQVNGNMSVTQGGNFFQGETNVVGGFSDSGGGNIYQDLNLNAAPVPFKTFDATCLENNADIIINGNVNISSVADAAIFQGSTVWVNGSVSITGGNISITGGGIFAVDGITVSGGTFTYTSTGCFALYSQAGDVRINNGPYNITGLIYTASTAGDIRLATSQGGSVCGALLSGRDVIFTGGSAIHGITNTGVCDPCPACNELCPT